VAILDDVASTLYYGMVTSRRMLMWLILILSTLLELAIFLRIVLPWFGVGYGSRALRLAFRVSEPLLRPIRRLLGRYLVISMFDFSAFLALLLIRIVTEILVDLVR
jgi:YggT family protein